MVKIREIIFDQSYACICLDSGERFWLHRDDLPKAGITECGIYDSDSFHQKIRLFQYPRALNMAVSMLSRRPCSKGEVLSRLLQRHFSQEVSDLVIYKLEKENLVNDREFCDQWIRFRLSRRYGPAIIRQELKRKGVPDDIITASFENTDPSASQNNALELARKIWNRTSPDMDIRKRRQKVISSLIRKGYDWDTVSLACKEAEDPK